MKAAFESTSASLESVEGKGVTLKISN